MANTLEALNISPRNIKDRLLIDADILVAGTSLVLKNASEVANGDILFLGEPGTQTCEKVTVTAPPSGTTVTISATKYLHKRGEAAYDVYGDQIEFMYAPATSDNVIPLVSALTVLADVVIDLNEQTTIYQDAASAVQTDPTSRWYGYVYRNSVTSAITDTRDIVPVRGGDYGHYVSLNDIRLEAGFQNNSKVTDQMIDGHRTNAEMEVNAYLAPMYTLPLPSPVPSLITSASKLLAAGYLMSQQYGIMPNTATGKEGEPKIKQAHDILDKIVNQVFTLVDYKGSSIASVPMVNGWPDNTTATYNNDNPDTSDPIGGDRMFRASTRF